MAPLLLAALAFLVPAARTADRVEPIVAEAPLTPTVAPVAAPAGSLDLPASAIPSGADVPITAPAPDAAASAWTQASPQAYAAAPEAAGRAVAARPYFAVALARAGVKTALIEKLQDYLAAPGRHPGPQDLAYHGLHHTYDVAALAARLAESPEADKLSREQRALLVLAAALHDVDPRREPLTPASVDRTLDYISDDPSTRQLVDAFSSEYGFTAGQLKALIKATDFSPDPKRAAELVDEAKAMLVKEFPRNGDWASTWSRRLAFADKMASYVADPAYADRQVRGLANEIKAPSLALAKGSINFLKPMRDSPDYALLPAELRANFETVLKHYEDVAADPEKFAGDFPPARGPPETAEARYAREAAAQPVSPELDAQLARLRKDGFVLLSAGGVMDPALARALLASVSGVKSTSEIELFERPGEGLRRSRPDYDGWKDGRARAFIARMTHLLNLAAPGENIVPAKAGLRIEYPAADGRFQPGVPTPHVDSRYLTVTFSLEGPGTDVFDDSSGGVRLIHVPPGVAVAQTAVDRAWRLGAVGAVHASPTGWTGRRVLLVINFESAGYANPQADEARARGNRRAEAVMRRFGRPEKAGEKGLLARIKGIIE